MNKNNLVERHLENEPTNPFTREKLTLDMLKPCAELKKRIEEYKKSKANKKN